jgi:ribosomal protein S6
MRRYELMLVLRPDVADDRAQAVIDRTTRQISASGGQIVKVAPFESPAEAIIEMERSLLITEEVLRHLVTRVERPVKAARRDGAGDDEVVEDDTDLPSAEDEEDDFDDTERIDESESEAAPAAID